MAIKIDFDQALHDMEHCASMQRVNFGPYSPTYIFASDEYPRSDIEYYMYNWKDRKYCETVLTVLSSGDQAFCCKICGAKQIYTFDITIASKLITDIKRLAIKTLNFDDYWHLLKNLWHNPNITSVPNFERIMPELDSNEQEYIRVMDGKFALFTYGAPPDLFESDKYEQRLIHEELHHADLPAFPFTWSDIEHLDAKLGDNVYDFIHLSNIFDYVSDDVKISVLKQLTERLNYGGRILMTIVNGNMMHLRDICKNIEKQSNDLSFINHQRKMLLLKCR